jgi:hypothetical protein
MALRTSVLEGLGALVDGGGGPVLGPIHEGARQMPTVGGVTAVGGQAGDDVDDLQVLEPLQLVAALAQHELCGARGDAGQRGKR